MEAFDEQKVLILVKSNVSFSLTPKILLGFLTGIVLNVEINLEKQIRQLIFSYIKKSIGRQSRYDTLLYCTV